MYNDNVYLWRDVRQFLGKGCAIKRFDTKTTLVATMNELGKGGRGRPRSEVTGSQLLIKGGV